MAVWTLTQYSRADLCKGKYYAESSLNIEMPRQLKKRKYKRIDKIIKSVFKARVFPFKYYLELFLWKDSDIMHLKIRICTVDGSKITESALYCDLYFVKDTY